MRHAPNALVEGLLDVSPARFADPVAAAPGESGALRKERLRHFDALLGQLQSESRLEALWSEHARIDRQRAIECDERDAELAETGQVSPAVCDGWPSWGERYRQSASAHEIQSAEAGRRVKVAKNELRRLAGLT
jgi:hypothetical protein